MQARNGLDALVHSVKKSLTEYGDKVGADEKAKIEAALKEAEELLKQKDATRTRSRPRPGARQGRAEARREMYAQAQAAAGGGAAAAVPGAAAQAAAKAKDDEKVVDAEFTEVKDKK